MNDSYNDNVPLISVVNSDNEDSYNNLYDDEHEQVKIIIVLLKKKLYY